MEEQSNGQKVDKGQLKRTEAFAGKLEHQVKKGPNEVEGYMDVPGLNLINPIASYATFDPVDRITNLADEASLAEDPSETT